MDNSSSSILTPPPARVGCAAQEASRCLRELALPFFNHELVKQALWAAMTREGARAQAMGLLKR